MFEKLGSSQYILWKKPKNGITDENGITDNENWLDWSNRV